MQMRRGRADFVELQRNKGILLKLILRCCTKKEIQSKERVGNLYIESELTKTTWSSLSFRESLLFMDNIMFSPFWSISRCSIIAPYSFISRSGEAFPGIHMSECVLYSAVRMSRLGSRAPRSWSGPRYKSRPSSR